MQGQLAIRPRRRTRRRAIAIQGSPLAAAGATSGGTGPTLSFFSWEDTRNQRLSAIYSLGLHLAVLMGLVLAALLAPPEIIEKIIPVALVRPPEPIELPGTNAEPAPAGPKAVGARRPANAAALAAAQQRDDIRDLAVAETADDQRTLWRLRESIPAAQTAEGASIKHDISLPVSKLPAFLAAAAATIRTSAELACWGPVPAPMARRAGRHRAHLMLHAERRGALHPALDHWQAALPQLPEARRVRWSIDVDPQDLL